MTPKTSLMTVAAVGTLLTGSVVSTSYASMKFPQFYVGIAPAFEHMSGNRSESLIAEGGNPLVFRFSDNQKFTSRNEVLSAIAGFQWSLPTLPLSIGPEVYLGHGNGSSLVRESYHDAAAAYTRTYTAELKRKLFYGLAIRGGWNFWRNYFGFLTLGIDQSRFSTDRFLVSNTNVPDVFSPTLRTTKTSRGFLMGIGLEKRFDSVCVGIDFKRVAYKQQNFSDTLQLDPLASGQLSFSARPKTYSLSLRLSYLF